MATFVPDSKGFQALALSGPVRAAVVAEAERAKQIAEALSQDFRQTGEYASSFEVDSADVEVTTGFGAHKAAAGILRNTSGHSLAVEFGNEHDHRAHHVLGKTRDIISGE